MRVFVSCGVQLVENQYLVTQSHSIGLKTFFEDIGCYNLITKQRERPDF